MAHTVTTQTAKTSRKSGRRIIGDVTENIYIKDIQGNRQQPRLYNDQTHRSLNHINFSTTRLVTTNMNVDELTGNNALHDMAEKRTNFTSPAFSVELHMLNAKNQLMQTPLIIAIQQKFIATVETLLELKPDPDCQDWT